MKKRIDYINSLMPIWDISHDAATAGFQQDVEWLFEIKEACEILSKRESNLKSAYTALLSIVTEMHKIYVKQSTLLAEAV